jgi:hypothetical protein
VLGVLVFALFGLAPLYIVLGLIGIVPMPRTDISETKLQVKDLSGADFQVIETDHDALAKEEFVSVYASESMDRSNWLSHLIHRKQLLFRYDPWNWDEPMPTIKNVGPGRVQISVGRVSSIIFQRRDWKKVSIDYNIGFVEYH